jgi:hypothetical protein
MNTTDGIGFACARVAEQCLPTTLFCSVSRTILREKPNNVLMPLEHATSPLPDGRDVIVFPRGASFGFVLPEQHTITVNDDPHTVYLAIPDSGSDFVLERIEEAPGELRVFLGAPAGGAHAVGTGQVPVLRSYSFPQIQDELQRLKTHLVSAGGGAQEAEAWAQGASHDSHTERLRARIRELEGR